MTRKITACVVAIVVAGFVATATAQEAVESGEFGDIPGDIRTFGVPGLGWDGLLGWSPVTRSLFRLKRKSQGEVDEAEDGARAILIEEGVATWIFGQAKALHFFEDMKPDDLRFGLLKTVRQFVTGYEVDRCPLWLWEEAILQGYAAFRFLKEHRRGQLHMDMEQRRLTIVDLPA